MRLAAALDPAGIEWLDQPCVAGDWEAAAAVKAGSNVATMVSGFLFTPQDLETAAAMSAADFVGLRLGQSGGRHALVEMCQISADLTLKPVLGGILQTDLATYFEAGAALAMEAAITDFVGPSLAFEPLLASGLSVKREPTQPARRARALRRNPRALHRPGARRVEGSYADGRSAICVMHDAARARVERSRRCITVRLSQNTTSPTRH